MNVDCISKHSGSHYELQTIKSNTYCSLPEWIHMGVQGKENQNLSGINCARSFKYLISLNDYKPYQRVINIFTVTVE